MNRNQASTLLLSAFAVAGIATLNRPVLAGAQTGALIRLQATTPGSAQVGNFNVTGRAVVGGFQMNSGAVAGHVLSGDAAGVAAWAPDGLSLPFSGTASLSFPAGVFRIVNSGSGIGVIGDSAGPTGFGVMGNATSGAGLSAGVAGFSASTGGRGVFGNATAGTGVTIGGSFQVSSGAGFGVQGLNLATTGIGIGGRFTSLSSTGIALLGSADAASGVTSGVQGQASSPTGRAVYGTALSATGANFGGYFESASATGTALFAHNTNPGAGGKGIQGQTSSTAGVGVLGLSLAGGAHTGIGVEGRSAATTGFGVYGAATSATGANFGGLFTTQSGAGVGVHGEATKMGAAGGIAGSFEAYGNLGKGIFAVASSATGANYGGHLKTMSETGVALFAEATNAAGGIGVIARSAGPSAAVSATATSGAFNFSGYFEAATADGAALAGRATAAGDNAGGDFSTVSPTGTGVSATVSGVGAGISFGVYGSTPTDSGRGVYGLASAGAGVNYGVRGESFSGTGFGVFSVGTLGASGLKPFRIDHPEDPLNKYLLHYSQEGPEPINAYGDSVELDEKGEAWVQLPRYFDAINRKPRYTLTPVGAPMPDLHVAVKVQSGRFKIAGGVPNGEVCWEVKAVRNDRFVQRYGAPVEVDKSDSERNRYQHPDLYGEGRSMGVEPVRKVRPAPKHR